MKKRRIVCLLMLVVLAVSGNVYAESGKLELGTEIFNLVTTFCGDAGTTRGFAWSATEDYTDMAIRYAKADEDWDSESITEAAEYEAYEGRLYYKAEISNLEAGAAYVYKIGDTQDNIWSDFISFTTEPDNITDFSFIGVTDPQGSAAADFEYYKDTLSRAVADDPNAAFMVNLGDMVNTGNDQTQWDYYFKAAKGVVESLPHMAVVGNHETRGDEATAGKHFSLQFNNPDNGDGALGDLTASDVSHECTKGVINNIKESVYSFDYGNAHFAVLNSGTDWSEKDKTKIMTEQAKWLKADLNASDKKWKIVMVHIGLYPAKTERYNTHDELLDVIDECGVDLVLSGHDHMVGRTYPMRDDKFVSALDPDSAIKGIGTIYNILGSAGPKRYTDYNVVEDRPDYLQVLNATSYTQPTYFLFDVNDERINVVAKQLDGTTLDEYSIVEVDLDKVHINVGTDEIALEGIWTGNQRITVLVTYPEVETVKSIDDICYIGQFDINDAGAYVFKFGDRNKSAGEYKIHMNVQGVVSQYSYEYKSKLYMTDEDGPVEKLSDISGDSLTAKLEIINTDNGRLYCAQYKNGVLVDLDLADVKKGAEDSMTISYLGSTEVDEIRLYFWDNTSGAPLMESVSIY